MESGPILEWTSRNPILYYYDHVENLIQKCTTPNMRKIQKKTTESYMITVIMMEMNGKMVDCLNWMMKMT